MKHLDYYLDVVQKSKKGGSGTGGITPAGTKTIDITQNGTTTHDVTQYATAKVNVSVPEPTGEKSIVTNGHHDVKSFASVNVNVPNQGITPSGVKTITENGTHDVTAFAQAKVDVPIPAEPAGEKVVNITSNGTTTEDVKAFATAKINVAVPSTGITPQGTKEITENGTHDVTNFAQAKVEVPVGITPAGTKEISISRNGEVTEDVTSFKNVHIVTNVPSSGGGTGGISQEKYDDLVSLFTFSNQNVHLVNEDMTYLCPYAFYYRTNLVSAILNGVTNVEYSVFQGCSKLSSIEMNSVETIGNNAFLNASALQEVVFPELSEIGSNVFSNCSALKKVKCDKATAIQYGAFTKCPALEVIDILGGRQIAMFTNDKINSLKSFVIRKATRVTPLSSGIFGFSDATTIYVADNLVEEYKVATNWSRYAEKIKPISEYVEV